MKTKTIKLDIRQAIITHADLLAERHATYVSQFVSRANDELYAILADILKLHEQLEASKQRDKLVKNMRRHLREVHGIKTQANTKTTALLAKYVTRASRKTAYIYSRVLEVAIGHGIKSSDLVAFIKQRGGIDKVRQRVVSTAAAQQHREQERSLHKAMSLHLAQQQALGTVAFGTAKQSLPCASDVRFHHLLCQFNHATQQHEVVAVLYPSSTLEQSAMNTHAIMLSVATVSDDNVAFRARCKELGLNMDIMLRWMASNHIPDAATAKALAMKLASAAQLPLAANHEWPKAA
jgi:hypothetical protein